MDCFICKKCGLVYLRKHDKCLMCGNQKILCYTAKFKPKLDLFGCDKCGLSLTYYNKGDGVKARNNPVWAKKQGYCTCHLKKLKKKIITVGEATKTKTFTENKP